MRDGRVKEGSAPKVWLVTGSASELGRNIAEALVQELAPFGFKVCALEPGGMRTNWGARASKETPDLIPDYEASVGAVAGMLKSHWGQETSDPGKVAQVVLRLAASDRVPAHLLLGSDAVQYAGQAEATRAADAER
jgi:NAD(P)-dependent dehydrogenase (short-subunit alcohol dehydrogenase family)